MGGVDALSAGGALDPWGALATGVSLVAPEKLGMAGAADMGGAPG